MIQTTMIHERFPFKLTFTTAPIKPQITVLSHFQMKLSSKSSNLSSSNSSMETVDSKSKSLVCKLPHQQSLPTPHHARHQLQQQLSQPIAESNKSIDSMQVSSEQQSDKSSLSSVDLESSNDCECDKASMSSSGQVQSSKQQMTRPKQVDVKQREEHQKEVEELKQEISKLKCDKLDLLRQNVVSFHLTVQQFSMF